MKLKAGSTELDLRVGSSQPAGHVPEQPSSVSIDPRAGYGVFVWMLMYG